MVDQISKKPLYYRYVPGNISDVSTLNNTFAELKALGVKCSFALIDAGYCSEENIGLLRKHEIDFLIRLPAGRKLYKDMVKNHGAELENLQNVVKFNKRSLFVKSYKVEDLYGAPGYIYMILDPNRKAKALSKLIEERCLQKKEEHDDAKDNLAFANAGIFMLISSKEIEKQDVLGAYYNSPNS